MIEYFYSALLLIGMILLFFAIKEYRESVKLLHSGLLADAKVVEMIRVKGDDNDTFKPIYEYIDSENQTMRWESEVSTYPKPHDIGDTVNIVYSDDEDWMVISFWGLYRWPIILLCIASSFIIIGGGYMVYTYL